MSDLTGKVALVTGGSRGIGAAIAKRLAEDGADVAITYERAADRARGVVGAIGQLGRKAKAYEVDAGDARAVEALVDRVVADFGRLDILVSNAGIYVAKPIEELSLDEYERSMAVNARAVFFGTQAAAKYMGEGGRVIAIGSCFAQRVTGPGQTLYAMSKSALTGLTKAASRELGPRGITVNLVHPGPIDTDMNPASSPDAEFQLPELSVGHFGTGEDIAGMVAYLAGPQGRYVTGTELAIDGGFAA